MKVAMISGVNGQDGSFLAELLLTKGYKVIGIKRRTSLICTDRIDHLFSNPNFIYEYGNLHDASCWYQLLTKYQPDEFYNLAAQSHVRTSFDVSEETVDSIVMGTLRILNAIKLVSPCTKFYQASSSEMFGTNPDAPFNETSLLMPASPYACAKVFAHDLIKNYRNSYGLFACSGILFNHESERRGETFVTRKITLAANRIKYGTQDTLYLGNLDAKRDWGYAKDYMEAAWLMLQQDKPDDYVVATGETHSVREFLNEVFSLAGLDPEKHVKTDTNLLRPEEVPYLCGDASKAKTILGWQPKTKFKELVKLMYNSDKRLVFG